MYEIPVNQQDLYKLDELNYYRLSKLLLLLVPPHCGFFKNWLLRRIISFEGGIFHSYSVRLILSQQYIITLGSYSYGNLNDLYGFPIKTIIGRYSSIGPGVRMFQANHPTDFMSMHAFFFRSDVGIVEKEAIQRSELVIGHDVWLGANAIICPGCRRVGNGAVVGAGAVVTKDVPNYAIVGGNPAKVIKMRFRDSTIAKLLGSSWWALPFEKIKTCRKEMTQPLDESHLDDILDRLSILQTKDD